MKQKIELLAPAGSIESFYAAVNSGADSVYLGGKLYNARANSQNFDRDEMSHIISYAHNKNVKVYVTLNIVLKDVEIIDALNYAQFLYENDVDAVIVQDLGLLYLLRKFIPGLSVNISTQAVVYDTYGVNFFEYYNVNRIIMAREMSLKQLKETAMDTKIKLEVFIHGALCTCYSGQCYMSSFLGGRSGNRGKCAQPCRLSYSFYDKESNQLVDEFGTIPVLSLKDLMVGETVPELIEAGISTLKIEGRMKGPEYTSAVVNYYREIIDSYYSGERKDLRDLKERAVATFSRGYTNSYLKPDKNDEMFAKISSGVKGESMDEIREETLDKAQEFSSCRRTKINFELTLRVGERARLIATDTKNTVEVKSSEACEISIKNPITEEMIHEQLGKLGNSIYERGSLSIAADEDVFVRKSTLNQLRRDAVDLLYKKGAVLYNRKESGSISASEVFSFTNTRIMDNPKISLKINTNQDFYLVDKQKVKRIYVPYNLDMSLVKKADVEEKYLYLPNIVSDLQYNFFKENMELYEEIFDGVCVNNVGSFYFFSENSGLKLHCGQFFNVVNTFSSKLLEERGAEGLTFSVEANIRDMESITKHSSLKTEVVAHQYVQLMTMKNCPMSLMKNCRNLQDCNNCSYRGKYSLKDRKGVYFNVERENRLTHIYNSVPLTLIGKAEDFVRSAIEYFMVDTKWLDNPEEVVDALYCEINGVQISGVLNENGFTRGHYLKNIL